MYFTDGKVIFDGNASKSGAAIYTQYSYLRISSTVEEADVAGYLSFTGSIVNFANHITVPIYVESLLNHWSNFNLTDWVGLKVLILDPPIFTESGCKIMAKISKYQGYGANSVVYVGVYSDAAETVHVGFLDSRDHTFTSKINNVTECVMQ